MSPIIEGISDYGPCWGIPLLTPVRHFLPVIQTCRHDCPWLEAIACPLSHPVFSFLLSHKVQGRLIISRDPQKFYHNVALPTAAYHQIHCVTVSISNEVWTVILLLSFGWALMPFTLAFQLIHSSLSWSDLLLVLLLQLYVCSWQIGVSHK